MNWGGAARCVLVYPLWFVLTNCSGHPRESSTTTTALPLGCRVVDAGADVCSSPVPSYANDIAPLIDRDCNQTCHAPGAGPWPLTSYEAVSDWAEIVSFDVAGCAMPPSDAGVLTPREQAAVIDWVACGAPAN